MRAKVGIAKARSCTFFLHFEALLATCSRWKPEARAPVITARTEKRSEIARHGRAEGGASKTTATPTPDSLRSRLTRDARDAWEEGEKNRPVSERKRGKEQKSFKFCFCFVENKGYDAEPVEQTLRVRTRSTPGSPQKMRRRGEAAARDARRQIKLRKRSSATRGDDEICKCRAAESSHSQSRLSWHS